MQEIAIKSHLIITDIHSEYEINWCGKMKDAQPLWVNNKPVFVLRTNKKRMELNTFNIKEVERAGKHMTEPKGREAITTDRTTIYLKEIDGNERLMGFITQKKIKRFAPMYDKVGWIG